MTVRKHCSRLPLFFPLLILSSQGRSSLIRALLVSLLVINPSWAETVKVVTGPFPPLYVQAEKDGGSHGVVLDLVRKAFEAGGLEVEFHFVPWARSEHLARSGAMDASCCWFDQAERKKHTDYSQPVYAYSYSFFHLKDLDFDWSDIEDLKGYRIGGTRSYTYTREFTEAEKTGEINVSRLTSDLQGLKMLLAKRIDAFPLNTDVGYFLLKSEFSPMQASRVSHHKQPLLNNAVHLVFPKQSKKSQRLLKAFNQGMGLIKDNGQYQLVVDAYKALNKVAE